PSTTYSLSYSDDGIAVGPTDYTSDASGRIIINALNKGNYDAFSLKVNGCILSSISTTVLSDPANPTVNVNSPAFCTGLSAAVTATPGTAGTYSYAWTTPAGFSDPGNTSSFTTNIPGTYGVTITNTITGCVSSSSSGNVSQDALPTVTVNSPATCEGNQTNVTATPGTTGAYSYAWTTPAGVSDPGDVASFPTSAAGNYSVVITNTATTCKSLSASGTVTINSKPTVTVNSPAVCEGNTATITATPGTSDTYSYAWTTPSGVLNPGNVASFSASEVGDYIVTITNSVTTCKSDQASGKLTINPKPTVTLNNPVICEGAPATFTATPDNAGTYDYVWTVPAGVPDPGNVSGFSSTVAGTYAVIITNTATTCQSASASGVLTANTKTLPIFTQLGPFCKDATVSAVLPLKSNNNIDGTWQPSVISSATTGVSTYTFKPDAGQCASDATMDITIKDLTFSVDAGGPLTINNGSNAQANAQLNGIALIDVSEISWSPAFGLSADNILDPVVTPTIPNGTLTYTVSVKDGAGCVATDNLIVNVIGECLNIKKAFSPNGDGVNDKWIVYNDFFCLKNISVNVYNRYGSLVYQNANYRNQWDGLYRGGPCPDGTYYAVLEIELQSGKKYVVRTDVTIVR
ncbi:MAG: gliding motility-associated C-terminal domain-containing protein, partial [Ferruginibacter sp.]|nr:gliding motility-associated C-terminal domain-containing protein [Ferruginibacter sp.]